MNPTAPAAAPITSNTNMPFGGYGQAQTDNGVASNILNYLPTQEATSTNNAVNNNNDPGSILPNISINAPTYTAPTAPVINAGSYGTNLTGYNTAVQNAEQGQIAAENSTMGSAQGELQSAESQYGNLTPVYQSLASSYNIPGYQQDVATLSGLLQNLNQDVNSETTLGGGLMTESARDEEYAKEANPLNIGLNDASQFLSEGQSDVNNLLDAYEKSLTNELTPLETNISNLPGEFGQANSATEAGYNQGEQTIQDTISNRISQQQANAASEQAASFAKEVQAQYGSGSLAGVFSSGSNGGSGQYGGVAFKNPTQGAAGGYDFTVDGKPASAVTWAAQNGQAPSAVIAYMAQNGDATAGQAYQRLLSNPNMSLAQLEQEFPSLAWGITQAGSTSASSPTGGLTGPQVSADANTFSQSLGGIL